MKNKRSNKPNKKQAAKGFTTTFDDIILASVSNPPIPQKVSKKSSIKATKSISTKGDKTS